MEHLLSVADAGLIITFFSCGQSTFMQCYSVALNKHLISATVHAGCRSVTKSATKLVTKSVCEK